MAERESEFFITLDSGIPVYSIFYIQVFLSIHRMRPINLILLNSEFPGFGYPRVVILLFEVPLR
jgi:hypothetical protein